jgi:hypothetical protein
MNIRMKDIAKDLGVSLITISKVLRYHPDIGQETRERVLARVKELDYRPNFAARSLVTGRSYLVGLVVPDLLHPFFAEIAKSLSEVLRQGGYNLIVSSSDEDPDLEEVEINHLLARRLDALIIASCRTTVDVFFHIERQNTPAPDATKVRLNFWSGPKVDMEKQQDGFWTITTPPLVPGFHYYTLVIDGAEVSDHNTHAFFGGGKPASGVEVPEPGSTY